MKNRKISKISEIRKISEIKINNKNYNIGNSPLHLAHCDNICSLITPPMPRAKPF